MYRFPMYGLAFLLAFLSSVASASEAHSGVVVRIVGQVSLYTNPSQMVEGPSPRVQYKGTYYTKEEARAGQQIKNGYIVSTAAASKVRIIFANGDTFDVGSDTFYEINWQQDKPPVVDLIFGKIRAFILKDGPRSGSEFKSKSMVLGVRGTDFLIAAQSVTTEVVVIRGAVAINNAGAAASTEALTLKAGSTARVPNLTKQSIGVQGPSGQPPQAAPSLKIEVRASSQADLLAIQRHSWQGEATAQKTQPLTGQEAELAALEKKAVANVLTDIKLSDPLAYERIKKNPLKTENFDALSSEVVQQALPAAQDHHKKPSREELEEKDKDAYDRYRKPPADRN